MKMKIAAFFLASALLLFACKSKKSKEEPVVPPVTDTVVKIDTAARNATLLALTDTTLSAIKSRNYTALAALVHPELGLRFSPYSFVDTSSDRVVSTEALKELAGQKKQQVLVWGDYDGSGDPIKLTTEQYLKEFVYDVDFIKPEKRGVDTILYSGNIPSNLHEVYPGCDFTESHFSGFDKKFQGMDWRSLRLVFKLIDGKYYLVGVVHDEWTT